MGEYGQALPPKPCLWILASLWLLGSHRLPLCELPQASGPQGGLCGVPPPLCSCLSPHHCPQELRCQNQVNSFTAYLPSVYSVPTWPSARNREGLRRASWLHKSPSGPQPASIRTAPWAAPGRTPGHGEIRVTASDILVRSTEPARQELGTHISLHFLCSFLRILIALHLAQLFSTSLSSLLD